jgi:hypothetical protein
MDATASPSDMPTNDAQFETEAADGLGPAAAVLMHVLVEWDDGSTDASILHASGSLLVLEATDPELALPPVGADVTVCGETVREVGRIAEHGRAGRFLVAMGVRAVRRSLRLRVSLPGKLRGGSITEWTEVELADLTTGGARIRGVELPVGTPVTLSFTPPRRTEPVTVRALVAHGTHGAAMPWIGVAFRLVALRGGR